jgi:uncharacterized oligopeptide transporter (OPT) family protein
VIPPYLELAEPSFGSVISWTLWPGAALMIASSITMLAFDARSLVRAVRRESIAAGPRVVVALVGSAIALVVLGWVGFDVPPIFAALGVILAAVFSIAAMQATGETDTTPAGPLGGIGQIATGSLGAATVADPLYAGGTVNGVAAHSAAMMNAWKAGSAVAATPSRLVVAQLAGIVVGAVGAIVAYAIIREAYGLGDTAMPAPGAVSWRVTAATVVGGLDNLPAGAPLAALVAGIAGIVLAVLQRTQRLSRMLPTPIAMGIGFVLPVSVTATLALAAILHAILTMRWRRWSEGPASTVGSGLIVGEAFAGILIATIIVLGDI